MGTGMLEILKTLFQDLSRSLRWKTGPPYKNKKQKNPEGSSMGHILAPAHGILGNEYVYLGWAFRRQPRLEQYVNVDDH